MTRLHSVLISLASGGAQERIERCDEAKRVMQAQDNSIMAAPSLAIDREASSRRSRVINDGTTTQAISAVHRFHSVPVGQKAVHAHQSQCRDRGRQATGFGRQIAGLPPGLNATVFDDVIHDRNTSNSPAFAAQNFPFWQLHNVRISRQNSHFVFFAVEMSFLLPYPSHQHETCLGHCLRFIVDLE